MLLVGFLEAFGAAWANGILDLYRSIGVKATISYMMANFVPVLIACGLWFGKSGQVWSGFVALFIGWFIGLLVTHFYLMQQMAKFPEQGSVHMEILRGYGNKYNLSLAQFLLSG